MYVGDSMKIKLYFENEKGISKSGIGKALEHQMKALSLNHVEFTKDHDSKDYDVLHVNTTFPGSIMEIKQARKMKKAVVYHAHSTEEDFRDSFAFSNTLSPLWKKWLIYLYSMGDCIVTPTEYSKKVLEGYGIQKPIYAISNGIDIHRFEYDQQKVNQFKEFFHIQEGEKVIISVGWLFERKGFDTFCEVACRMPEYTFIWFGDKNLSMPSNNIRKWIENKPKNVILPGYIAGDVILGAYMGADLFFFPSREETEGIVVLEALAAKCKVLVRDIPVYDGWLFDHKNCYKGKSLEAFIDLIPKIIDNQLPDLTEEGYHTAQERGFEAIGKQLIQVYEKAIEIKGDYNEKFN